VAERRAQDADARWVAEQAPRMRADAREAALREARDRLRDDLVEALLAATRAAPGELQDPPPRSSSEPRPGAGLGAGSREGEGLAVWVYGVMPGDVEDLPRRPGVDAYHEAGLIRHGSLAAVASAVPRSEFADGALERSLEDLDHLAGIARGHEHVLDGALEQGPVVPFRIGTLYDDPDGVREMLARERRPLDEALERLRGKAEWGLKAYLGPAGEGPAPDASDDSSGSGTAYLARRRDEREAMQAAQGATDAALASIHERLGELACGAVLSAVQDRRLSGRDDEMVLNAAYLVPDTRVVEFHALVWDLTRRNATDGLVLELTGPWPAYHFAGTGAVA
jgi:hypothetical protein